MHCTMHELCKQIDTASPVFGEAKMALNFKPTTYQYSAVNTILVNNDANRMLNVTSKVHFVSGWLRFCKRWYNRDRIG